MAKLLLLILHNLLFPFALCFMAPGALRKMKARGGNTRDLWQRFGFFTNTQKEQLKRMHQRGPLYWVHAASVGEAGIACKLIREMLRHTSSEAVAKTAQRTPQFVVTTTTPTGLAQVQALPEAQASEHQNVLPLFSALDGWFIVRRFLRTLQPKHLILVEAEVWPNLTFCCQQCGIPVSLINARLSPRSERRYRQFLPFSRALFGMLQQVMVQEPEDVSRWASLGLDPDRIHWTGSVKFDPGSQGASRPESQIVTFTEMTMKLGWNAEDPVMLLASTHPGEEVALAQVYQQVCEKLPPLAGFLRLIIVPRHVERSETLQNELQQVGLTVQRRSLWDPIRKSWPTSSDTPIQVLLVDTTGELRAWQYLATVVIVGKSFLAHGGQNPAEAIMAGKPVVFGPNMENFAALVEQLLRHNGALQCQDLAHLEPTLLRLLHQPQHAADLAQQGWSALKTHEGATQKTAHLILASP